jgi:hypothetical protein
MVEYFWSRDPGRFVDKTTGEPQAGTWNGSVREWYETLVEVIYDVSNTLVKRHGTETAVRLTADPNFAIMAMCSVLWGTRLGTGATLLVEENPDMRNSNCVNFVSGETGEVLGAVRVLDMPCLAA